MKGKGSIWLFVICGILGAYPVCAQDTVTMAAKVRTERSSVVGLVDRHYGSPVLKQFLRPWNVSTMTVGHRYEADDRYVFQLGSGYRRLGVHAESLRHTPGGVLWGEAEYRNQRTFGINYSESLDFEIIAPYVMADSVGGALTTERYAFRGGYAWGLGKWDYGAEVGFRGDQGYRNRDPRLHAVVADIDATLAAGFALTPRYRLAADLGGRRYRQVNKLNFVNELGQPLVYHESGLGVYNTLLAGTRTHAYFTGFSWAPTVYLVPRDRKGWFATVGYKRLSLHKELSGIADPIAKIKAGIWHGKVGYAGALGNNHALYVGVSGRSQQRDGYEARFNNRDVESGMQKIDESRRYINERQVLSLDAAIERDGARLRWTLAGSGGYGYDGQSYVAPERWMSVRYRYGRAQLSATRSWAALWLTGMLDYTHRTVTSAASEWGDVDQAGGVYRMLTGNFAYLSSGRRMWRASLRTDMRMGAELVGFLQVDGGLTHFDAGRRGNVLNVNVGLLF